MRIVGETEGPQNVLESRRDVLELVVGLLGGLVLVDEDPARGFDPVLLVGSQPGSGQGHRQRPSLLQ